MFDHNPASYTPAGHISHENHKEESAFSARRVGYEMTVFVPSKTTLGPISMVS